MDLHLAQAIIEGTSDAVYVKDSEGRYLLVNRAAADFLGAPKEAILGRTDLEFFIGEGVPELLAGDRAVMESGRWTTREETLTANGTRRTFSSTKGPLRDESGVIVGLVGISRDVSAQKASERQLAVFAERLQESNTALERFAQVVSHDLKEPLRGLVIGVARARRRLAEGDTDGAIEVLLRAEASGKRMHGLIDALLNDAKLSATAVSKEACDTRAVFDLVLRDLAPSIEEVGATVIRGDLPVLPGDEVQLSQVFSNLLVNVVRHSGKVEPTIRVDAKRVDGFWRFTFDDDGVGVPAEDAERVFLPFERLRRCTAVSREGVGIGLATCRRIVERHGGKIWVERSTMGGASFRILLPANGNTANDATANE